MGENKIKILIAKVGFDTHDTGSEVFARDLRENGFEVVYLGMHQTPDTITKTAIEEKADIIGISMYAGGHEDAAREIIKLLREHKSNIPVIFGGFIPTSDIPTLKEIGVAEAFPPGISLTEIRDSIRNITRGASRG